MPTDLILQPDEAVLAIYDATSLRWRPIVSTATRPATGSDITYAEIQDVSATDRVLGRSSPGAGVIEEIVCTSFARTILDDVNAAAVRATIGAGTGSGTVTDVTASSPLQSSGGVTPNISIIDVATLNTFIGTAALTLTGGDLTVSRSNSGSSVDITISNTSDTASSVALVDLLVAGASAGDAYIRFGVSGSTTWSVGLDNSVSDSFSISASSTLGTTEWLNIAVAGDITARGDLYVTRSFSGGTVQSYVSNTSNTASSSALHQIQVAGTTAADPYTVYSISGGQVFSMGIDNSVLGDPFVISVNATLGTTNALLINTAGAVQIPTGPLTVSALGAVITAGGMQVTADGLTVGTAGTVSLQQAQGGRLEIKTTREAMTMTTTPQDSTANLLPANSLILGVGIRVTTAVVGTLTTFTVGDPTTAGRFAIAVPKAVNTTAVGIIQWSGASTTLATGPSQVSAAKIRIASTSGTLTAGVIELIVYSLELTAPTS